MLTQSQHRRAERRGTFEFYHVSHNGACLQKTDGAKCEANRFLGNMRSRGSFSPEHASVWWNHTHTHTRVRALFHLELIRRSTSLQVVRLPADDTVDVAEART